MSIPKAVSTAFGIAAANVTALLPFAMVVFVPLCAFILHVLGIQWELPEFTRMEISEILEIFAIDLLRKRMNEFPIEIVRDPSRKHSMIRKFNTKSVKENHVLSPAPECSCTETVMTTEVCYKPSIENKQPLSHKSLVPSIFKFSSKIATESSIVPFTSIADINDPMSVDNDAPENSTDDVDIELGDKNFMNE